MAGRRGRGPLVLVAVLIVLAALLVGADRGLHRYVEGRVADQLQASLGTPTTPTVTVQGFPFLTQAAANRFRQVDVRATDVPGDSGITVQTLDVHLYDVRTADRYRQVTAGRLDGQATLGYDAVSTLATLPISSAGQGRIKTEVSTSILGQQLSVTLSGVLGVNEPDQTLVVSDPAVQVAGIDIPAELVSTLATRFLPPIPVGQLPLGVRLASVQAGDTDVVAEVTGTDVVVSG